MYKIKKLFTTLLLFSIVFSVAAVFPSALKISEPVSAAVLTQLTETPSFQVVEDGVRFRATPSLNGTILGLLYQGETLGGNYDSIANTVYADGYYWIYLYRYNTNQYGWVTTNYLIW